MPCVHLQCLQYQTDQQSDVKKVEKLNNLFFGLMAAGIENSEGELSCYHTQSPSASNLRTLPGPEHQSAAC